MSASILQLVCWREPLVSSVAFTVGLVFFYATLWCRWSAVGLLCDLAGLHLVARLGQLLLFNQRPAALLNEQAAERIAADLAGAARKAMLQAASIAAVDEIAVTATWTGAALLMGLTFRLLGTTVVFFVGFLAAFTLPRIYEAKHEQIDAALAHLAVRGRELGAAAFAAGASAVSGGAPTGEGARKKRL